MMQDKPLDHLSGLIGTEVFLVDRNNRKLEDDHRFCQDCKRCDARMTHLYGSSEACRWNGQYIYYCSIGLIFCVAADDRQGIVIGPVVMGDLNDTLDQQSDESMRERIRRVPCLPTDQVRHLCDLLYHLAAPKAAYHAEVVTDNRHYLEYEKRLKNLLELGDRHEVQVLINELIGKIYFVDAVDIHSIKQRIMELAAVLSRATIDVGADINLVFSINDSFIKALDTVKDIDELNVWLMDLINRFMDCTFNFGKVRTADLIHKIYDFIRTNIDQRMSVEEISKEVFLSKNYVSSIFKEYTGQSLTSYINGIRINKSKKLLLEGSLSLAEIAGMCGFEDQSYFTNVFKGIVGVSPNRYRKSKDSTKTL
jgi:two-component system response regulator YesN